MASQRHKLWEQGSTAAGEIHAQGVVAPGIAMQVDPQAYNVLKAGPPLYNTGLELREPPDMTDVVVPVGEYGGPLSGSTLTGAIPEELVPPDPNPEPPDPDVTTPELTSLEPASAPIQSGDITIQIHGTGFSNETIMMWNGADDHAAYVSETQMSTVVKTSLATVPSTCTVVMRNGSNYSNTLMFELTAAEAPGEERTFPVGPVNLASIVQTSPQEDPLAEGMKKTMVFTLSDAGDTDLRDGDTVLVEATGNTSINGTYTAANVTSEAGGTTFEADVAANIAAPIEAKGRVTVTG